MARIARRSLLATALATPAIAQPAIAQPTWPSRGLVWVVPFAAGGITDSSSRVVAQRLSTILGQPIVVENRPGAGGTIGSEAVARAPADGHTLLYGSQGPGPWLPYSRVWPSAGARATASLPMVPPAPGRFSTTMGWPRIVDSRWATTREELSVMPPAAKGTTQTRPRLGQVGWAMAGWAMAGVARAVASRLRRAIRAMGCFPLPFLPAGYHPGRGSRRLR